MDQAGETTIPSCEASISSCSMRATAAVTQGAEVEPDRGRIHGAHFPGTQGPGVTGSLRSSAGRSQRAVIAAAS